MAVATKITPYYRLEGWAFSAYETFFAGKTLERASASGARLLQRLGPLTGAHRTTMRNLRLAFPEHGEDWRRDVAHESWGELGRMVAELPHMPEFTSLGPTPSIEIDGREHLAALHETGGVLIGGHFSNWEAMGVGLVESGLVCHITYRPANNPIIDRRILDLRARYGVKLQAAKGVEGGVGLLRALKRKETVVLMNDQKYNEGAAAPFFGHVCMTADGPTRLAHRFGVPLVPLSLRRVAPLRFRMRVHEPLPILYEAPAADAVRDAVPRINAWVESVVREAPGQWFWMHRRWPKEAWAGETRA